MSVRDNHDTGPEPILDTDGDTWEVETDETPADNDDGMAVVPDGDMTLRGSLVALLRHFHRREVPDPELLALLDRAESALTGPDWLTMASTLGLDDAASSAAADSVLSRWGEMDHAEGEPRALLAETSALMDALLEARALDAGRTQQRLWRVADALAAAADHGAIERPLERLASASMDAGTVLCFPVRADWDTRQISSYMRTAQVAVARLSARLGFKVGFIFAPEDAMPRVLSLKTGDNPPEGVALMVVVGGQPVEVTHTSEGWAITCGADLLSGADQRLALDMAREGHGRRIR